MSQGSASPAVSNRPGVEQKPGSAPIPLPRAALTCSSPRLMHLAGRVKHKHAQGQAGGVPERSARAPFRACWSAKTHVVTTSPMVVQAGLTM